MTQRKMLNNIEYGVISAIIILSMVGVYLHYKNIHYWIYVVYAVGLLATVLVGLMLRFRVKYRLLKGRLRKRAKSSPQYILGESAVEKGLHDMILKKKVNSPKGPFIVLIGDRNKAFVPVNPKWDFITLKLYIKELRIQHNVPIVVHHDPPYKGYMVNEVMLLQVIAIAGNDAYYNNVINAMERRG